MDIFPAKPKAFTDVASNNQNNRGVSLGEYTVSFEDLLSKGGSRLGGNMDAFSGDNGILKATERMDKPAAAEKRDFNRRDDSPRTQDRDDYDSERKVEYNDVQESKGNDYSQRNDETSRNGNEQDATSKRDDSAPSNGDSKGDSNKSENVAGKEETTRQDDVSGAPVQDSKDVQKTAGTENADQVLNDLIIASQNAIASAQSVEQAGNNKAGNAQSDKSAEELSAAINAVNPGKGNKNGADGTGGQQAKANTGTAANNIQSHNLAQSQEQESLPGQAQAQAKAGEANSSTTAQQAAELSKIVGEGNRIAVNVNVSKGEGNVISQPGSNLTASTILASESPTQQQTGQQGQKNHTASVNPLAANGVTPQNQGQQASAQIQAGSANGLDAKGSIQGVQIANAGGPQAQTVGGDTIATTAPSTTSETPQTLKNTTAQTSNTQQANVHKQAVLDQVSVQITKAIKAGMDKINIQLRPENLGRVDVRIEVGHDGRAQAVILADSKDTLDLLQRDARELERALIEVGVELDNKGLEFGLRNQHGDAEDNKNCASGSLDDESDGIAENENPAEEGTLMAAYKGGIIEEGRVDIRA